MFCPPGTHQYNPKFPKIPLKLNEFESEIYNPNGFDSKHSYFIMILFNFLQFMPIVSTKILR